MSKLCVEPFKYSRAHLSFTVVSPFELTAGTILCVEDAGDAYVSDFLQVITGLDELRRLTNPAIEGELVRGVALPLYDNEHAVHLVGQPVRLMTHEARARAVAFVFANPDFGLLGSTVAEEFQYSAAALGKEKTSYPSVHALEPYGLSEKLERPTSVLSGGERHRLSIACAMERDCDLLVLDLTRSNLDLDFEDWILSRLDPWLAKQESSGGAAVILTGVDRERLPGIVSSPVRSAVLYRDGTFVIDSKASRPEVELPAIADRMPYGKELIKATDLGRLNFGRRQSFNLRAGEILAFHGPNGCGKTSIAHLLAGRERQARFAGEFDPPATLPALAVQNAERSFLFTTVDEELENSPFREALCLSAPELESHPRELPYGKQKLVSVAITLSLARDCVVLDEPSCGMDDASRARLIDLFNLRTDLGILMFTHDPALQILFGSKELGGT